MYDKIIKIRAQKNIVLLRLNPPASEVALVHRSEVAPDTILRADDALAYDDQLIARVVDNYKYVDEQRKKFIQDKNINHKC